jgi:hypothetical protein
MGEMGLSMIVHGLLAKAASTAFTGAVGVAAYELARKAVNDAPALAVACPRCWPPYCTTRHRWPWSPTAPA